MSWLAGWIRYCDTPLCSITHQTMLKTQPNSIENRLVFILSVIGIVIAIYVTQSFLRQTSIFCVNGGGCEAVRKASQSWLFGVFPVPAIGLIGYTIIAFSAFLNTIKLPTRYSLLPTRLMLGMSTFGMLFVSWFTYTEIFIIKGICTWCAISAVNMFVIFGLVAKRYILLK